MSTINPDDIRIGDTVQRTCVEGPIVVSGLSEVLIWDNGKHLFKRTLDAERATYTWELIDRPVEKPAWGSRWKHKNHRYIFDGTCYVLWASSSVSDVNIGLRIPWTDDDDNEFKLDES